MYSSNHTNYFVLNYINDYFYPHPTPSTSALDEPRGPPAPQEEKVSQPPPGSGVGYTDQVSSHHLSKLLYKFPVLKHKQTKSKHNIQTLSKLEHFQPTKDLCFVKLNLF